MLDERHRRYGVITMQESFNILGIDIHILEISISARSYERSVSISGTGPKRGFC